MLASGEQVTADTVKHIDRCLSCLSCMTTCPSGVQLHAPRSTMLGDGSNRITVVRGGERVLRRFLGTVLSRPLLFRLSLRCAAVAKPLERYLPEPARAAVSAHPELGPAASPTDRSQVFAAEGDRRMRVALLPGCAQRCLAPEINEATIRLLTRHGCEVVVATRQRLLRVACPPSRPGRGGSRFRARQHRRVGTRALASGLDAIVINASGCGTTVKDYGFMLREDPAYAEKAARDRYARPRCHRGRRDARPRPFGA